VKTCRVVLVDDQVLFVQSLSDVLQYRASDISVVAIGNTGQEAIDLAIRFRPDIMLLDVRMPEMSGVEAVRIIHENDPKIRVVMLTTYDDDEYVARAMENGAIGYLLKDMPPEDLINAIHAVNGGSFVVPANIAQKLIQPATGSVYHGGFDDGVLPEWYYQLSARERRILRLLSERYSNGEIADRVHLAEQTVKNYLSTIYQHLGVANRREAIELVQQYVHFM